MALLCYFSNLLSLPLSPISLSPSLFWMLNCQLPHIGCVEFLKRSKMEIEMLGNSFSLFSFSACLVKFSFFLVLFCYGFGWFINTDAHPRGQCCSSGSRRIRSCNLVVGLPHEAVFCAANCQEGHSDFHKDTQNHKTKHKTRFCSFSLNKVIFWTALMPSITYLLLLYGNHFCCHPVSLTFQRYLLLF